MFLLNGQPLAIDTPFTVGGGDEAVQYPANWLRHASEEEKAAIGITEEADPPVYDSRFYWGVGAPKALEDTYADEVVEGETVQVLQSRGLKYQRIQFVKETAGKMLAPTDWMVLRQLSRNVGMSAHVENYRNAVVDASNEFEAQITACTTVEELAALEFVWPDAKDF